MEGSSSIKGGRPIVLNHNGLEDEEGHETMDSDSEDDEAPPQLVFTDGSCSDSQLSQDSPRNSVSPCEILEPPRLLEPQECTSDSYFAVDKVSVDMITGDSDTILPSAADAVVDSSLVDAEEERQTSEDCLLADDASSMEPSTSFLDNPEKENLEHSQDTLSSAVDYGACTVEPSTSSSNESDKEDPQCVEVARSSIDEDGPTEDAAALISNDMERDEVDMEVSSGDEDETEQRLAQSMLQKKRIEENIQALMKEFERKRLEEKARKTEENVPVQCEQALMNVVSTTSEVSSASDQQESELSEKPRLHCHNGERKRGPSTPEASPPPEDTPEDDQESLEKPHSSEPEREDSACELPSSSIEVPPVPTYEEIEQCIYKIETKKKAVSLMCFCRGNNLDCSDTQCDNRAMFTECPKNCLGKGKDCRNRRFAKREYAPVQAYYTGPNKGFGVQAVAPIKKGEFIIEYVGEVVSSEEFAKRLKRYGRDPNHTHHYMFEIGSMIIDATKKGNCSRFMNHSCEPNAVCEKWYVPRTPCAIDRIGFFAKRDIELGEEITFDYQFENYGREAQRCFCGASSCTGWIGKPPELIEDDFADEEVESPSDDSGGSADEDTKQAERVVIRRKKYRYSAHDNVTVDDIEKRLEKALKVGCRNKTHVLGWIKLMTEMALIKREDGIAHSMHRIMEAISTVDTSLQHIFVANGLPSIFKSWLRTSSPDSLTREDLDLKHCIIRSLLAMQSCADAINARSPDLLAIVTDLAAMPTPNALIIKDIMEQIMHQLESEEHSPEQNRFHESLELRFERLRNAAIRLQAVLQQHVNFRIPKKKVSALQSASNNNVVAGEDDKATDLREGLLFRLQNRVTGPLFRRLNVGLGTNRPRLRVSRWSADYRPLKRPRSVSRVLEDDCVIRCRIGPTICQTTIEKPERPPSTKRNRLGIDDDQPIIVTKVRPNWSHPPGGIPSHPPVAPNIPPPPPNLLSPSPMVVPPPPPTMPPVYATAIPYYEYAPFPGLPVPPVQNYSAPSEYPRPSTDEFDVEEYRKYYLTCDVPFLQSRLHSLVEEMSLVQSILDQKTMKKEQPSPMPPPTPQPPTPKTPPPPPHKEYMWRKAVDEDGAKYYYHRETRESVWELPEGEESDPGERTPTRMPDTSGCGNDTEAENGESKPQDALLSRWSSMCSPQVPTSNAAQSSSTPSTTQANPVVSEAPMNSEKKRDRDRRVWEKFGSEADRKRAKKLMNDIEKVVGPIIIHHIGHREDATKRKKEWIIKQVSKEMLKRESERPDFNFVLTDKGSKRVTDYADAFIQRKCAKEPKEMWKGYDGSP
ncbi:hypothetical protein Q1695_008979 [Nippostrongylus brasiliensis]|nr:hypothetical protein Q1695_008979 [Nippostrongylus brasiliensis]